MHCPGYTFSFILADKSIVIFPHQHFIIIIITIENFHILPDNAALDVNVLYMNLWDVE